MPTDRISGFNMGVSVKVACQVATTGANITLAGTQTIDGISVGTASERVLVKNQTSGTENGIYIADSSTWIRARDCDGNKDLLPGSLVYVDRGNINRTSFWVFNSSSTATSIVVGQDALTADDVTSGLGTSPSAWVETNFFPVTSASSARSVIGAFPTTGISTFIEVNLLPVANAAAARAAIGAASSTSGLSGIIDITAYGAVPSSTSDATSSIRSAVTAAAGRSLYIPPGTFWLTGSISNSSTLSSTAGLTIYGAGQGVSELRWFSSSTDTGVMLYGSSNSRDFMTVRDIRLTTLKYNTGTALYISSTKASTEDSYAGDQSRYAIERCTIAGGTVIDGGSATASGWNIGIETNVSKQAVINDCTLIGPAFNAFGGSTNSFGTYIHGEPVNVTANGHPVQFILKGNYVLFHEYGAYFSNCEGIYITHSNYVADNYGIIANSTGQHPQFFVNHSHFNAKTAGIMSAGMVDVHVTGNLIYQINNSTLCTGVNISSATVSAIIDENIFSSVGTTQYICVNVLGGYTNINNNTFRVGSPILTCVHADTGSSAVYGSGNIVVGSPANKFVNDSGSTVNLVTFVN